MLQSLLFQQRFTTNRTCFFPKIWKIRDDNKRYDVEISIRSRIHKFALKPDSRGTNQVLPFLFFLTIDTYSIFLSFHLSYLAVSISTYVSSLFLSVAVFPFLISFSFLHFFSINLQHRVLFLFCPNRLSSSSHILHSIVRVVPRFV